MVTSQVIINISQLTMVFAQLTSNYNGIRGSTTPPYDCKKKFDVEYLATFLNQKIKNEKTQKGANFKKKNTKILNSDSENLRSSKTCSKIMFSENNRIAVENMINYKYDELINLGSTCSREEFNNIKRMSNILKNSNLLPFILSKIEKGKRGIKPDYFLELYRKALLLTTYGMGTTTDKKHKKFPWENIAQDVEFVYSIENVDYFNFLEPYFYGFLRKIKISKEKIHEILSSKLKVEQNLNCLHLLLRLVERYFRESPIDSIQKKKVVQLLISYVEKLIESSTIDELSQIQDIFMLIENIFKNTINIETTIFNSKVKDYTFRTLSFLHQGGFAEKAGKLKLAKNYFVFLNRIGDIVVSTNKEYYNLDMAYYLSLEYIKLLKFININEKLYRKKMRQLLLSFVEFEQNTEKINEVFQNLFTDEMFKNYERFFNIFGFLNKANNKLRYCFHFSSLLLSSFKSYLKYIKKNWAITKKLKYINCYIDFLDKDMKENKDEDLFLVQFNHFRKLGRHKNFPDKKRAIKVAIREIKRLFENFDYDDSSSRILYMVYDKKTFQFVMKILKGETNWPSSTYSDYIIKRIEHMSDSKLEKTVDKINILKLLIFNDFDGFIQNYEMILGLLNIEHCSLEEKAKELADLSFKTLKNSKTNKNKTNIDEKNGLIAHYLIFNNLFAVYDNLFSQKEISDYNSFFENVINQNEKNLQSFIKRCNGFVSSIRNNSASCQHIFSFKPLTNIFCEGVIINSVIKSIKTNKDMLNIKTFCETDLFVEILNNYFKVRINKTRFNGNDNYMVICCCLVDDNLLNNNFFEFIRKLNPFFLFKCEVINLSEIVENDTYKQLGFFKNNFKKFVFYNFLVYEVVRDLEETETNNCMAETFKDRLFCIFFDKILTDIEFFQSASNISIGTKTICRIIKFYMNTSENKLVLFGDTVEKFYNVFIGKSSIKYYEDAEPVVKNVLDYFHSFEYKY